METVIVHKRDPLFEEYMNFIVGQSASICRGMVSHTYLRSQSGKKANMLIVVIENVGGTRSSKRIEVKGFALIQNNTNDLYVDIICAKGVGKHILREVYNQGYKLKKKYITLSALPRVINFYRGEQFIHTEKDCNENSIITNMAEKVKGLRFKSDEDAQSHKTFNTFLKLLMKHKLVADKRCRRVDTCSISGYSMTKCL